MYSFAAVGFIAVAAAGGVYLSQRTTVAQGAVLADDVHGMAPYAGVHVTCDERVPITVDGADFTCEGRDDDGSTETIACSLKPNGSISCKTTEEHRQRKPKTGDVWK